ncbi:hypothetical protein J6590_007550 [Homalodisca vitripennis]|nr:hypothetical protein J6590_007550 [Homalodisca vitripennis]
MYIIRQSQYEDRTSRRQLRPIAAKLRGCAARRGGQEARATGTKRANVCDRITSIRHTVHGLRLAGISDYQ